MSGKFVGVQVVLFVEQLLQQCNSCIIEEPEGLQPVGSSVVLPVRHLVSFRLFLAKQKRYITV